MSWRQLALDPSDRGEASGSFSERSLLPKPCTQTPRSRGELRGAGGAGGMGGCGIVFSEPIQSWGSPGLLTDAGQVLREQVGASNASQTDLLHAVLAFAPSPLPLLCIPVCASAFPISPSSSQTLPCLIWGIPGLFLELHHALDPHYSRTPPRTAPRPPAPAAGGARTLVGSPDHPQATWQLPPPRDRGWTPLPELCFRDASSL